MNDSDETRRFLKKLSGMAGAKTVTEYTIDSGNPSIPIAGFSKTMNILGKTMDASLARKNALFTEFLKYTEACASDGERYVDPSPYAELAKDATVVNGYLKLAGSPDDFENIPTHNHNTNAYTFSVKNTTLDMDSICDVFNNVGRVIAGHAHIDENGQLIYLTKEQLDELPEVKYHDALYADDSRINHMLSHHRTSNAPRRCVVFGAHTYQNQCVKTLNALITHGDEPDEYILSVLWYYSHDLKAVPKELTAH